jgi:hypothetical protein
MNPPQPPRCHRSGLLTWVAGAGLEPWKAAQAHTERIHVGWQVQTYESSPTRRYTWY